jgi:hypothetical protein
VAARAESLSVVDESVRCGFVVVNHRRQKAVGNTCDALCKKGATVCH